MTAVQASEMSSGSAQQ